MLPSGALGPSGFVDGAGRDARFSSPTHLALQRSGSGSGAALAIVLSDRDNHALRRIHLQSGRVDTLACRPQMRPTRAHANEGTPPASASATPAASSAFPLHLPLNSPAGVLLDPQSSGSWLLLADGGNHLIRKLWLSLDATGGGGSGGSAPPPRHALWAGGQDGTLGWENEGDDEIPTAAAAAAAADDETAEPTPSVRATPVERPMTARRRVANRMAAEEAAATAAAAAAVAAAGGAVPSGVIAIDAARPVPSAPSPPAAPSSIPPGGVPAPRARFSRPSGLCWDASSNVLLCDRGNRKLKKISTTGMVSQILPGGDSGDGSGGGGGSLDEGGSDAHVESSRLLYGPECVVLDARNHVLIADTAAHCIRRLSPSGHCAVIAGQARVAGFRDGDALSVALFSSPRGLAVDARSQCIFVSDADNHAIRMITPQGVVVTIAGKGAPEPAQRHEGTEAAAGAGAGINSARSLSARPTSASPFRSYSGRAPPDPVAPSSSSFPLGAGASAMVGAAAPAPLDPEEGFVDGLGGAARFFRPEGLVFDAHDDALYVCDSGNNAVRRLRIERDGGAAAAAADAVAGDTTPTGFAALVPSDPFPSARLMPGHQQQQQQQQQQLGATLSTSRPAAPGDAAQLGRHASMPSFRSPLLLTGRPGTAAAAATARPSSSDSPGRRWGGGIGGGGGSGGSGGAAGALSPSLDAPPLPVDPLSWSRIDVAFWLLSLSASLDPYVSLFHAARIDGAALLARVQGRGGEALLCQIGVSSKMHRNTILRAVLRLANPGEEEEEEGEDMTAADSAGEEAAVHALDDSDHGSARGSGTSSRVGSASSRSAGAGAVVQRPLTASGWRPSSASTSRAASAAAESLLSKLHLSNPNEEASSAGAESESD